MRHTIVEATRDRMILSCKPVQSPSVLIDLTAGMHIAMMENAKIMLSSPKSQTSRIQGT